MTKTPASSQQVLHVALANPGDGFNFGELDVRGDVEELETPARKYPHLTAAQNDALAELDRRRDAHSASEDSRANRDALVARSKIRRVK